MFRKTLKVLTAPSYGAARRAAVRVAALRREPDTTTEGAGFEPPNELPRVRFSTWEAGWQLLAQCKGLLPSGGAVGQLTGQLKMTRAVAVQARATNGGP